MLQFSTKSESCSYPFSQQFTCSRILLFLAFTLLSLISIEASGADKHDPNRGLLKRFHKLDAEQLSKQLLVSQQLRAGDEIWLVSSRALTHCVADSSQLAWFQFANGCLNPRTFEDLQAAQESDPFTRTLFYAHGNNTSSDAAIAGGLTVYRNMFQDRDQPTRLRFVIWSWPSQRQTFPIGKDADLKSRRAVSEGELMRTVLDQIDGPRPNLLGYSFGGQVVVSALQSPTVLSSGEPFCVSLIAPGFNRDFLHLEMNRELLDANTKQMNAFVNKKDRVIWANNTNYCRRKYSGSGMCDHRVSSKLNGAPYLTEVELAHEACSKHSIALYSQNQNIIAGILCQLEHCGSDSETEIWIEPQPLSLESLESVELPAQ